MTRRGLPDLERRREDEGARRREPIQVAGTREAELAGAVHDRARARHGNGHGRDDREQLRRNLEFGDRVRARAITAGGQSGDPASPHFNDQAARYSTGNLREVYFYRPQLQGHTERTSHPGK